MKRMKVERRILVFLFCVVVILTGMYAPKTGIDSSFSYPVKAHSISTTSNYNKGLDAKNENFRTVADDVNAEISSGAKGILAINATYFKYLFSTAVLPLILAIAWLLFIMLMQSEFINKMYQILFIHNSDGKKGDRQAFVGFEY